MFHYFTKLYNQMKLLKYVCYARCQDKVYTGHAIDIVGCITIGDITIGLAWWVPHMGQKSL